MLLLLRVLEPLASYSRARFFRWHLALSKFHVCFCGTLELPVFDQSRFATRITIVSWMETVARVFLAQEAACSLFSPKFHL